MRFVPDQRAYSDTAYCLDLYARPYQGEVVSRAEPIPVHWFWSGAFGLKQTICIKSFLVTQRLEQFELVLWTDNDAGSITLGDLAPFVSVRQYVPGDLAQGTPLADHPVVTRRDAVFRSDFVRLLVLNRFGGLYTDMDFLFLRDLFELEPVSRRENFAYSWSGQRYCNHAFMFLGAGVPDATELMRRAAKSSDGAGWSVMKYDEDPDALDMLVLPCPLIDPFWLAHDGVDRHFRPPFRKFRHFFRKFSLMHRRGRVRSVTDLFGRAFAYHWHNCWLAEVHPNSFFGMCAAEVEERFQAMAPHHAT